MNTLLLDIQTVSEQLLPILGAVALIFLCIVLKKAWELIEELTKTVRDLGPTIKLVDESMEKVQAPLDTVVKISHTVDDVHDKTATSITKLGEVVSDNIDKVKMFFADMFNRNEESSFHPTDESMYDDLTPNSFEEGFNSSDEEEEDHE